MAVVIQREVRATRSGVAFSVDPTTGEDALVLECVFGHGESLVGGRAVPDRYRVAGERVSARLAARTGRLALLRTLRDDEALAVAALTLRAERGFGHAVDVEFSFDEDALWILQCRAVTTAAGPS